jgi:hypothetical protein
MRFSARRIAARSCPQAWPPRPESKLSPGLDFCFPLLMLMRHAATSSRKLFSQVGTRESRRRTRWPRPLDMWPAPRARRCTGHSSAALNAAEREKDSCRVHSRQVLPLLSLHVGTGHSSAAINAAEREKDDCRPHSRQVLPLLAGKSHYAHRLLEDPLTGIRFCVALHVGTGHSSDALNADEREKGVCRVHSRQVRLLLSGKSQYAHDSKISGLTRISFVSPCASRHRPLFDRPRCRRTRTPQMSSNKFVEIVAAMCQDHQIHSRYSLCAYTCSLCK